MAEILYFIPGVPCLESHHAIFRATSCPRRKHTILQFPCSPHYEHLRGGYFERPPLTLSSQICAHGGHRTVAFDFITAMPCGQDSVCRGSTQPTSTCRDSFKIVLLQEV